jgi:NADH-quinone oxidoreductase subunit L
MTAGMFHLFNHAFFKALLFLGAGSVIHALETNDIGGMGGLAKSMPWTTATFAVGALSLAGFFPLSGFFSKDAVLAGVLDRSPLLFALGLAVSFLTAFYMGRMFFTAFTGRSRSSRPAHESGWVMLGPMVALAALSVASGWWAWGFAGFVFVDAPGEPEFHLPFVLLTQAVPLGGLGLAFSVYRLGKPDPGAMAARYRFVHELLRRRYYVDEAYDWAIDRVVMAVSRALAWFDRNVVDGAVNGVAWLSRRAGDRLRALQTGSVQDYAQGVFWGVVVLMLMARLAFGWFR